MEAKEILLIAIYIIYNDWCYRISHNGSLFMDHSVDNRILLQLCRSTKEKRVGVHSKSAGFAIANDMFAYAFTLHPEKKSPTKTCYDLKAHTFQVK